MQHAVNRFNCSFKNSNYNALSERLYFFIEADSPLNNSNTHLPTVEFHNFRNVRPYPPEKLTVHEIGQRNATLSWDIKEKLIILRDANGLIHEVSWKSGYEETYHTVIVHTTEENLKDRSVWHTLTDLEHPYTSYTVRVRSVCGQAEFDDLWSGYSDEISFQTLPDVPSEVPSVPPGAYYFDNSDGSLTIYWEKVSSSFWNGPNFSYVIDYVS
jgi:hypothetical protein